MKIEGKDFLEWLHDLRKKAWTEETASKLSSSEWTRKMEKEAEQIVGHPIPKLELTGK